jgi:GntR family transcriptional regulator, transcriptional repressor for pyruvate dehydrogenase complex
MRSDPAAQSSTFPIDWDRGQPAPRTSVDTVYERIRELIQSGELGPGQRLPAERQLCEMLSVSRPSLREGLRALRGDGYVRVERGVQGGTFVSDLAKPYAAWLARMRESEDELQGIIDVRLAVEGHLARLAAERRSPSDLEILGHTIDEMSGELTPTIFRRIDSAFHTAVARAAASERLANLMLQARGELFVAASTPIVDERGMRSTKDQHELILSAIRQEDPDAAAAAMKAHIQQTHRDVSDVLWPTVPDSQRASREGA